MIHKRRLVLCRARARRTRVSLSYFVACTEMTKTPTATATAILYVRASGTSARLCRREVKRSEVSRLYDVDVRSFSFRVSYYVSLRLLSSKLLDLINSWWLFAFWIILSLFLPEYQETRLCFKIYIIYYTYVYIHTHKVISTYIPCVSLLKI